jgi:fluoroacetyl-CoA thioesterase
MSSGTPPLGLRHKQSITVTADLTVPSVSPHFPGFHDMPAVFATAFMVGFVEDTCVAALKPHLAPGQRSVGHACQCQPQRRNADRHEGHLRSRAGRG